MSRVVVFKTPQDLIDLRTLLFGSFNEQKRGLQLCKAYEVRGPLPPSVHITCLLLAAIHGDVPGSDLYMIRAAYSMALIRFVNETLDAAQQGRSVVPLYTLAANARLPGAFVELRHAATHESLPSVHTLRDLANRALAWLYDEYWVHQEATRTPTPTTTSTDGDPESRIKELFREWRRLKRQTRDLAVVPADLLARLQQEVRENSTEVYNVVLYRNILVPAGSGPVRDRELVIALWEPLLLNLGPEFCRTLADRVLSELRDREWPAITSENRKYAMLELWAERLSKFLSLDAVRLAQEAPRPWNARVIARYASSVGSPDLYEIAKEMAEITGTELTGISPPNTTKASTPGWTRVPHWTPRPIGVLHA